MRDETKSMGHDDFPEEDTDPGIAAAAAQPGHFAPQTGGHAPVYPGQHPQHQLPQYPQHQPQQQYQHQHPQHPQPHAHPQHPQQYQQDPSGMMRSPQTGGHPVANSTGGYHQVPQTGGHSVIPQHPGTGGFAQVPSAPVPLLEAPVVQPAEEKASRVVYGLSGMAFGGIMGVVLGVINTFAEGQTITQGTEFIMMAALWTAFLVGGLAFWKPERFDTALDRLQDKLGNDEDE